jgi:hypothetical protein
LNLTGLTKLNDLAWSPERRAHVLSVLGLVERRLSLSAAAHIDLR